MKKNRFDVSILLNCHDEINFIFSTLLSINAAISEATNIGLKCQLIIVIDRGVPGLIEEVTKFEFDQVVEKEVIEVNFGSLGPARNAGVQRVEGRYVLICDADDLMSSNTIVASFEDACRSSEVKCYLPEYIFSFGRKKCLTKIYSSQYFSPCDFLAYHPFCSRIFINSEILRSLKYIDCNSRSGFAFEDWELNSSLICRNIELVPVKDVVLFYRQRKGSIMASTSINRIPPLHQLTLLSNFSYLLNKFRRPVDLKLKQSSDVLKSFENSVTLMRYLYEAQGIDPSLDVSLSRNDFNKIGKNLDIVFNHWGYLIPLTINLLGSSEYDDIYLLPSLNPGGGEKYLIQILNTIQSLDASRRSLVITLERSLSNRWINKLPLNCQFLNFEIISRKLKKTERYLLLFRLLLIVSSNRCNLHVKTCTFSMDFLDNYGEQLAKTINIYRYLFCFSTVLDNKRRLIKAKEVETLRNQIGNITKVINDNQYLSNFCLKLLGKTFNEKFPPALYAYAEDSSNRVSRSNLMFRDIKKFLWASRICDQKRIDLVPLIIEKLKTKGINCSIDVYGSLEKAVAFPKNKNISYKGEFTSVEDIPLQDYLAFVYTSSFDGIPNILVELMARGIPVIAPVGKFSGISELVTPQTGWPVLDNDDVEIIVDRYVSVILNLISNNNEVQERVQNALNLIKNRHSKQNFLVNTSRIFGIEPRDTKNKDVINNNWQLILSRSLSSYRALRQKKTISVDFDFQQHCTTNYSSLKKELIEEFIFFDKKGNVSLGIKEEIKIFLLKYPSIYKIVKRVYNLTRNK